jgi:hypothetical protein
MSGPEFSDLKPVSSRGYFDPFFGQAYSGPGGLEFGTIHPIVQQSNVDCFREGETLLVYLEVAFPALQVAVQPDPPITTYVSGLRICPFWLRSNVEFRTPGNPGQSGNPYGKMGGLVSAGGAACPSQIDKDTLGIPHGGWDIFQQPFDAAAGQFVGDNVNTLGNRNTWFRSPKRLDTVPPLLGSAPLAFAIPGFSDSLLLYETWLVPLPNPSVAPWNAAPWIDGTPTLGCLPNYRRNHVLHTPVYGRALGVTFEILLANLADDSPIARGSTPPVPPNDVYPFVRIGYRSGVTHGVLQERAG